MKKIISLFLITFLVMSLSQGITRGVTQASVTQFSVTVNPAYSLDYGEYKIDFVTGADLLGAIDSIYIQFPKESTIPCTSCAYGRCPTCFTINGITSHVGLYNTGTRTIYMTTPGGITIKKGDKVEIVIAQGATFQNPSMPGKYTLTLWTDKETDKAQAQFEILSTNIESLSVSNDPETSSLVATYKIAFRTGSHGSLTNGQYIYVEFPQGTIFPTVPNKNSITINGENPQDISLNGRILSLKLPYSINEGNPVSIFLLSSFGLQNPVEAGVYSLNVWTDTEPVHVSTKFTVVAQKTVSTQIETSPQSPDGTNNIFRTTPLVTLTAETNTGETIQTFYKIDSESYKAYSASFTIPEGSHTVYYYSKTATLTEKERSYSFVVDLTPPTISVEVPPQDPYYTGEQTLSVVGNVSEKVQIIINDALVLQNPNGGFTKDITLNIGENIIQFRATDSAGWTTTKSIRVIYDTTVPTLNVTEPQDFSKITSKNITVKGLVQPANTDVYIGNDKININPDGSFECALVPQNPSSLFAVKVTATYPYSQKTVSRVITVIYEPANTELTLTIGNKNALVNGKSTPMDTAPFIDSKTNRTYVPVRFVAEFLNGTVDWNSNTRTITISIGGEIKLVVGSDIAYVNGKTVKLDAPVFIKDNRSFVPLRFIAENLGFKVVWNQTDKTISISK